MTESEASSPPATAMSETDHSDDVIKPDKISTNISFSIWPPAQRTRDAVTNRLIETLSTPSVLSKRYGTMTVEEAGTVAKLIEDEAFTAAAGSGSAADDDGIEILQIYSKEISKRMLETVKARAGGGDNAAFTTPAVAESAATSEGVPAPETESV